MFLGKWLRSSSPDAHELKCFCTNDIDVSRLRCDVSQLIHRRWSARFHSGDEARPVSKVIVGWRLQVIDNAGRGRWEPFPVCDGSVPSHPGALKHCFIFTREARCLIDLFELCARFIEFRILWIRSEHFSSWHWCRPLESLEVKDVLWGTTGRFDTKSLWIGLGLMMILIVDYLAIVFSISWKLILIMLKLTCIC